VAADERTHLDGLKCGFLKSVDGGAPVGDVISESGSTYFTRKHLGTINYEPFVLQFGLAMAGQLYDWINASWNNKYTRKNGAVVATDVNFNAVSQREFFNALISETTIPRLDGSSKEPGYLTLKVAPCERMELHLAAAKPVTALRTLTARSTSPAPRATRARTAKGKRKR